MYLYLFYSHKEPIETLNKMKVNVFFNNVITILIKTFCHSHFKVSNN